MDDVEDKSKNNDLLSASSLDPFPLDKTPRQTSGGTNVTGIILAGGKSRRFATNKAFLTVRNRPIIAETIHILSSIFQEVLIVTNQPDVYNFLTVKKIKDIIRGKGPLGGLYTGLQVSDTEYNFVVACDMPFLNPALIRYMLDGREGFDVVVPCCDDGLEPLHAVYSKACLGPIQRYLNNRDLKLQSFFREVRVNYIRQPEVEQFDPNLMTFININYREDYQKVKEIAQSQER